MAKKKVTKEQADFVDIINDYKEVFHIGAFKTTGVQGWFRSFIKSSDFKDLRDEDKDEAFNTYQSLRFILEEAAHTFPVE